MFNAITRQVLNFKRTVGNPAEGNTENAGNGIKLNNQQRNPTKSRGRKCC